MSEITFRGKSLFSYTTEQLHSILQSMYDRHLERKEATKHEKFNIDRTINGKTVKKMEFPSVNPNFTILKDAILEELEKRK